MVAYRYVLNTQEAGTGRLLQIQGEPRLHSETHRHTQTCVASEQGSLRRVKGVCGEWVSAAHVS